MLQIVKQKHTIATKEDTFRQLKEWIMKHIHKPIQGFEHKRNPDGRYYTFEQQILATRYQVMNIADYFLANGKSYDEILNVLRMFRG